MKTAYYVEFEWYIAIPENLSNEDEIFDHFEDRFLPFVEELGLSVLQVKHGWMSAHIAPFPGESQVNNWLDQMAQEAMNRGMHLKAQHVWGNLELKFENHNRDWLTPDLDLKDWQPSLY